MSSEVPNQCGLLRAVVYPIKMRMFLLRGPIIRLVTLLSGNGGIGHEMPKKEAVPLTISFKIPSNSTTATDTKDNRSKRGALILYSMVKCSTGCDPLIYKGYGCYCGFLGSGRTLDGIDRYFYNRNFF